MMSSAQPPLMVSPPPPDLSHILPKLVPRKRAPTAREPPSAPPPPTPALPEPPTDLSGHVYSRPSRRILSAEDHALFLTSDTCTLVEAFIFGIADSVRGRRISSLPAEAVAPTTTVGTILRILDEAGRVLDAHPREDTGSRFGNPVFRAFLDALDAALPAWHAQLGLDDNDTTTTTNNNNNHTTQATEVSTYLAHAFGNKRRIDYGSGHELNFFLWLLCLNRLHHLPASTFPALALAVLPAYLRLMRRIQEEYYLEPAGSHGVWGLDDYQFLPFLFGAAQLLHHPYLTPRSIHNTLVLEQEGAQYLYLDQIAFVNSVKNVEGLRWHSPLLDDISAAKNWAKIEAGMRRMFRREILEKLPVMQHFLFGSLIPAGEGMRGAEEGAEGIEELGEDGVDGGGRAGVVKVFDDEDGKRHVHAVVGWGDCCGIRVPAAVGAEGEARKGGVRGLRRVPFD